MEPPWIPEGPPERFGQPASAPYDFGRAPDADSPPGGFPSAMGPESRPLMGQDSPGPPGFPAGAGHPAGPYGPYQAGPPGPADPQGGAPAGPEWLEHTGELPTIAGHGYLNAAQQPVPETLDTFPPPGRRRKTRLLTTAMVVALVLLAGIAIFATRHPGGKAGHTPSPVPGGSRAAGAQASKSARGVSSAPASPGPISTALIFPSAAVVADGIPFSRVLTVLNYQCGNTARGAFAAALKTAGCQRVVRATFVDFARQYAVTAGVAQLSSPAAARLADRNGKFGPDVWFTGLDGPAGSGTAAVSRTVGFGYDVVYGRYIIYALATYGNGQNPTGHPVKVGMLQALSRSFTALTLRPLQAPAK